MTDILVEKSTVLYRLKMRSCDAEAVKLFEKETNLRLLASWAENSGKANWIRRVLPSIAACLGRLLGIEISFHLAQALTSHGYFQTYLYRMTKARNPG